MVLLVLDAGGSRCIGGRAGPLLRYVPRLSTVGPAIPRCGHHTFHGTEEGASPRQRFDDRRGRWSDASTHGHRTRGPSRDRAANRARALVVRNAYVTKWQSHPALHSRIVSRRLHVGRRSRRSPPDCSTRLPAPGSLDEPSLKRCPPTQRRPVGPSAHPQRKDPERAALNTAQVVLHVLDAKGANRLVQGRVSADRLKRGGGRPKVLAEHAAVGTRNVPATVR